MKNDDYAEYVKRKEAKLAALRRAVPAADRIAFEDALSIEWFENVDMWDRFNEGQQLSMIVQYRNVANSDADGPIAQKTRRVWEEYVRLCLAKKLEKSL